MHTGSEALYCIIISSKFPLNFLQTSFRHRLGTYSSSVKKPNIIPCNAIFMYATCTCMGIWQCILEHLTECGIIMGHYTEIGFVLYVQFIVYYSVR